jgi:hypothetical protein
MKPCRVAIIGFAVRRRKQMGFSTSCVDVEHTLLVGFGFLTGKCLRVTDGIKDDSLSQE